MSALGSVVVELSANIAKFQSDFGKAAAIAEQRAREIEKSTALVKNALGAVGLGFAVGATFDSIKSKIEGAIASAAGLQHLAERTGSSVEALSGLAAVAKLSNTDVEGLAGGLQKLAKAQIDAENGGKKTSASFEAIGISIKDIQGKRPDETFKLIADRLIDFQDGAEKVVIAQNLLGKSGANLLPLFKDLAELGDLQVKVTKEQSAEAIELEKNQRRLAASADAVYKIIGLQLVPVLNAFTKTLLESANGSDGVKKSVQDLADDGSIRSFAEGAAKAAGLVIDAFEGVSRVVQVTGKYLGATAAAVVAIASGDFAQVSHIRADVEKDVDGILQKVLFSDRLKKQLDASRAAVTKVENKPRIDTSGLGNENAYKGPKDDPTKKLLDGALKNIEETIAAEKKLLSTREKQFDFFQGLQYFSLRESETKKQDLIIADLAAQEANYDKEVALLKAFIARKDATQVDKADATNKLQEVAKRRAAAEVDANEKVIDSQNKLLAVQRNFDLVTGDRARQAEIANQSQRFGIDLLGKNTLEVMKAIEARRVQLALDERIFQLRKADPGADTSQAIAQAAVETANSQALITEAYNKQRDAVFGADEAIRKYQEDAGNKGAQIEAALSSAFKGAEDALVQFATTGKLSFKGLADSIVADISRILIKQQLAKGLASIGSAFGEGGGGFGSLLAGVFGGGKASGGAVSAGGLYEVGEQGPEVLTSGGRQYLLMGAENGTVTPNGGGGGGVNQTINFVNNGPVDRRTQDQVAARAAQGAQRAMARNS